MATADTEAKLIEMIQSDDAKQRIYGGIQLAQHSLQITYSTACKINPMAADTQVFKEIQEIQQQFTRILVAVSKLRGLA